MAPATSGMPIGNTEAEEDQPKRPLSAYNIFFQVERQRLIGEETVEGSYSRAEVYSVCLDKATRIEKSKRPHRKMHGRISFIELAKSIASKWRSLDAPERKLFEERADDEKRKYAIELEDWLMRQVPTQPVKKRLSALRRGSLSKYIQGREHKQQQPQRVEPRNPPPPPMDSHLSRLAPQHDSPNVAAVITPESSRRSSSVSLVHYQVQPQQHPQPPHRTCPHSQQMERGRNLERLYRMQLQLYNEQMRIQAECNQNRHQLQAQISSPFASFQEQHQDHFNVEPQHPLSSPEAMVPYNDFTEDDTYTDHGSSSLLYVADEEEEEEEELEGERPISLLHGNDPFA
eukprot:scaffold278_cov195-Amphora_coffeaeformis.AAC.18